MNVSSKILSTVIRASEQRVIKKKIATLKVADNELLRDYLHRVLDPQHNFYMTKRGMPKPAAGISAHTPTFMGMLQLLDNMRYRIVTGNDAKDAVANFLYEASPELRTLLTFAIDRKLPGNIGAKIVNAAFPGLIYHQPYGGVASFDAEKIHKRFDWDAGVLIQDKVDGMALFLDVDENGVYSVHTRQGQDVTSACVKDFEPVFKHIGRGYVGNVELMLWSIPGNGLLDRTSANGLLNSYFQGETDLSDYRLVFYGLDMISRAGFYGGIDKTPAGQRFGRVKDWVALAGISGEGDRLMLLAPMSTIVYSVADARLFAQKRIGIGGEGAVIKDPGAPWKDTKMTSQMKLKNEFECSLEVVDWKPHTRNIDWIGSLLVRSSPLLDDGPNILSWVGSGLNEDQESELCRTNDIGDFIGMVVEIKAENISKHNALTHPRITGIRYDKVQADTYNEVRAAYNDSISLKD